MRPARTAAEIAHALGGARRSGRWWRCRCPVHSSRGPTLALRDGACGLIMYCHAGCCRGDLIAELRRRGLIGGISDQAEPAPAIANADYPADVAGRRALARRIWDEASNASGTPVGNYLAGRNIALVPPSLRWSPRCWNGAAHAYLPTMVGAVRNVDGALLGVHRTYLMRDDRGSGSAASERRSAQSAAAPFSSAMRPRH
jgi:putative DNA primase/helicase